MGTLAGISRTSRTLPSAQFTLNHLRSVERRLSWLLKLGQYIEISKSLPLRARPLSEEPNIITSVLGSLELKVNVLTN
uniref:Uncharacterized protein n=1 Tax=Lepeophtheirus salmonis TaxID=72036 RepID=A0A0K2TI62_LEPSM